MRSAASRARSAIGAGGVRHLGTGRVEGDDPLAAFSPTAAQHLLRTDGFAHVADIMVGSFYDPDLDEGCAFEELISFHGGIGGPQTERVHPPPARAAAAGRAADRRGPRQRGAARLAVAPPGRRGANGVRNLWHRARGS